MTCEHEDVQTTDVGDVISEPPEGVYVSLKGRCTGCGASMQGTARQTSPDGDFEDEEWETE